MGLEWCMVLLADSWLETPTAFGVPMGVLLLFLILMKMMQDSKGSGSGESQRKRKEEDRRQQQEENRITWLLWRKHGVATSLYLFFVVLVPCVSLVVIFLLLTQDKPNTDLVLLLSLATALLFFGGFALGNLRINQLKQELRKKESRPKEEEIQHDARTDVSTTDPRPTEYFLRRGSKTFGPFAGGKLVELAESGKLKPNDGISPSFQGPWRAATSLGALKAVFDHHDRRHGGSS